MKWKRLLGGFARSKKTLKETKELVKEVIEEQPRKEQPEYTPEKQFGVKWNTLKCAMALRHQCGVTDREILEGIDLFKKPIQVKAYVEYLYRGRKIYNANPLNNELLPDNILEMVENWTEKDYVKKRSADHEKIFGQ